MDTSYDIKNNMLLDRLKGVPDEKRTARFVCAVAAAFPDGTTEVVRGQLKGVSATKSPESMVLAMIRSFISRNTDARQQNLIRRRRMN